MCYDSALYYFKFNWHNVDKECALLLNYHSNKTGLY